MDITKALRHLRPNEQYVLNGDEFDGLVWMADTPPPSYDELVAAHESAVELERQAALVTMTATDAAFAHAKSLGFTDEMIAVMYPNLGSGNG